MVKKLVINLRLPLVENFELNFFRKCDYINLIISFGMTKEDQIILVLLDNR